MGVTAKAVVKLNTTSNGAIRAEGNGRVPARCTSRMIGSRSALPSMARTAALRAWAAQAEHHPPLLKPAPTNGVLAYISAARQVRPSKIDEFSCASRHLAEIGRFEVPYCFDVRLEPYVRRLKVRATSAPGKISPLRTVTRRRLGLPFCTPNPYPGTGRFVSSGGPIPQLRPARRLHHNVLAIALANKLHSPIECEL